MNTIKSFSIGLIIMYTVIWLIMAITVKNSLLLAYTIFTIIFSMFAILGICKGKYTILHVYEVIILLSYVLVGIAGLSLLGMALKDDCSSTFTYFQHKMLQTQAFASNLLCSEDCPCSSHQKVQECPQWIQSPFDDILSIMEDKLDCSGWCNSEWKLFSTHIKTDKLCYQAIAQWLQVFILIWLAIIMILFLLLLAMNYLQMK